MYSHSTSIQEHSLELSSLLETLDRLDDSLDTVRDHPNEDISTESSSALFRKIGIQRPFKVDKQTLVNHLDGIYYDVIKSTYFKTNSLMNAVRHSHNYFNGHFTTIPENLKFSGTFTLELDQIHQQTLHVNDRMIELDRISFELERFLEFFITVSDKLVEDILKSIEDNRNLPDTGHGLRIVKFIPQLNKLMNNLTVTWKKDHKSTKWKSTVVRTRSNLTISTEIDLNIYRRTYRLYRSYLKVLEDALKKSSLFIDASGPSKDKDLYKLIAEFYAPIYLCVIRNLYLMSEILVLCRDNVKGVMR